MVNDIQAHQASVDTLNDAGRKIIDAESESTEASDTQHKLSELNAKWNSLICKADTWQSELENNLKEAQAFDQEVQDLLLWLNEIDASISEAEPTGGLPETSRDQLDRFMEIYKELESSSPKIEALLGRGNVYIQKSKDASSTKLQNSLKILKARWENVLAKASDKRIKLEIALKEATEFHESLKGFMEWLSSVEKSLLHMKPISRILENIKLQIEEHQQFQSEISSKRETMLSVDKKGTHLKYFSQKQDVILINNQLLSIQQRWEKVVSKSAEHTRALDYCYKEAKEFHDSWDFLCNWLDAAAKEMADTPLSQNNTHKVKMDIQRHKVFQQELSGKQPMYDATMKTGKQLIDKAPGTDEPVLKSMLQQLKEKWMKIANLSVEKQKKLEEILLFSGQFKEAFTALMDWLKRMEFTLDGETLVHGDLDTVLGLVEKHKNFEEDLNGRTDQVESLQSTAHVLMETAGTEDAEKIRYGFLIQSQITVIWHNLVFF